MNRKINNAVVVYFSPTHTSRAIARGIAAGTGLPVREIDITYRKADDTLLDESSLLIAAMPVYGGNIPEIARQRFDMIRGKNTPATAVVVYGNRAFEKAACQLSDMLSDHGFTVVAAGAFVGEHSYSTELTPIAVGRPNEEDCAMAEDFGKDIAVKIEQKGIMPVDVSKLKTPASGIINYLKFVKFVLDYTKNSNKSGSTMKPTPKTDKNRCIACGLCVSECPVGAIQADDIFHIDAGKCIRCCACVKCCPEKARSFKTPFAAALSEYFAKPKPNRICLK